MIKKEATIAIFIGLIIGLIITGGILRARTALQKGIQEIKQDDDVTSNTPKSPDTNTTSLLNIITPADNSVVSEATITLNGTAQLDTYIAIIAEKSEHLIVPNEVGAFSQEIKLIKGANTIKITVYKENGDKVEKTLNIVYTTAEI